LDFDAHESIRQAGNKLIMAPVIRVRSLAPIAEPPVVPEGVDSGASNAAPESDDPAIADAGAPVPPQSDIPDVTDGGAPAIPTPNTVASDAGDAG
ncbi:MAG TPA: hypothetical protein VL137_01545, partial [Polyangiaceae bacterium]|nr:hypothetical protein [Polyangiaceae bacterium]